MFFRKIGSSAIITMIICCSFLFSYLSVPDISYAEPTEQQYEYISNKSDVVAAIQSYLNYRGLGVICDVNRAADEWLINQQIELQDLFSGVEKTTGGILRYRFSVGVLQTLNSLVGDLVEKYNFAQFDDNNQEQLTSVYSGKIISDDDGNQCLVYILSSIPKATDQFAGAFGQSLSLVVSVGTWFKYSTSTGYSLGNKTWTIDSTVYDFTTYDYNWDGNTVYSLKGNERYYIYGVPPAADGKLSVLYDESTGKYYLGSISTITYGYYNNTLAYLATRIYKSGNDVDIKVKCPKGVGPAPDPDTPVTPRKSNGDTYNYNEGDTYIDNSVENNTYYYVYPSDPGGDGGDDSGGDGGDDSGGGGGESDTGCNCPDYTSKFDQIIAQLNQILGIEQPDYTEQLDDILDYYATWQTTLDTISDDIDSIKSLLRLIYLALTSPQDFDPGELVDYDFGLPVNLDQKFPFCIPFDLLIFSRLMMTEPETPHFEGTIDLHIYQWQIDFDFSDFDDLAEKVRAVEFLAFLVGLMILTMKLFKG